MAEATKASTDVKNPEIDQVISQDIGRCHVADHHTEYNGKYGFAGDEVAQAIQKYTPNTAVEKKMRRKADLYQIPILWLMCVMAYVDRNNIVCSRVITQWNPNTDRNRAMRMLLA